MTATERAALLDRITAVASLRELSRACLVVEAIVEDLETKRALFRELEQLCRDEAILATNTSSISITAIGGGLVTPERLVGMHFFNPAPVMKLVEIVPTLRTDALVLGAAQAYTKQLGKTGVLIRDFTGFVVNRLLTPYMVDASDVIF